MAFWAAGGGGRVCGPPRAKPSSAAASARARSAMRDQMRASASTRALSSACRGGGGERGHATRVVRRSARGCARARVRRFRTCTRMTNVHANMPIPTLAPTCRALAKASSEENWLAELGAEASAPLVDAAADRACVLECEAAPPRPARGLDWVDVLGPAAAAAGEGGLLKSTTSSKGALPLRPAGSGGNGLSGSARHLGGSSAELRSVARGQQPLVRLSTQARPQWHESMKESKGAPLVITNEILQFKGNSERARAREASGRCAHETRPRALRRHASLRTWRRVHGKVHGIRHSRPASLRLTRSRFQRNVLWSGAMAAQVVRHSQGPNLRSRD